MVGITLSPEQIRTAPPEVRRWLEHEVAAALGLPAASHEIAQPPRPRLLELAPEEASAVFGLIRADYLASQVFFELARETPNSRSANGYCAFSIAEIARHVRLGDFERVAACFRTINSAVQQVRIDREATLFGFDQYGYCYFSEATQQGIRRLWQEIVATQPPTRLGVALQQRSAASPTGDFLATSPKPDADSGQFAYGRPERIATASS